MKKLIMAFALVAALSTTLVSCSTDDSALEKTTSADGPTTVLGNGNTTLPPQSPPKI